MTSTRPYLIRAFYDWIIDNDCTPHIVVNAGFEGVEIPDEYVEGGQIVLNISLTAVQGLCLGEEAIEFQARFGGQIRRIYAPVFSILAIYAKENGRGMVFAEEDTDPPPSPQDPKADNQEEAADGNKGSSKRSPGGRPHLTIVK